MANLEVKYQKGDFKMDELVALVMKKTGLPKETAQTAVKAVLDFLKQKLPPIVGEHLDQFLRGGSQMAAAENLLDGLLGGTKKK
jgi:uncharacterized protein (DUF2267 family)